MFSTNSYRLTLWGGLFLFILLVNDNPKILKYDQSRTYNKKPTYFYRMSFISHLFNVPLQTKIKK